MPPTSYFVFLRKLNKKMVLTLDDNHTITTDRYNFTLIRNESYYSDSKKKNIPKEVKTYHATLSQALRKYLQYNIKDVDVDSVDAILTKIEEVHNTIKDLSL